jgi:formylmethanofuran dehydrogenase subunit E
MDDLQTLLAASAARHSHLCPRQVLGVRAGLAGLAALCLIPRQKEKHLMVVVETDGCFTDGIEITTGVAIGHRTLRIEDYGKIAATFVKIPDGEAVRISPRLDIRQRAWDYAPSEKKYYYAQLHAYQVMPESELFIIKGVELALPLEKIISRAGIRTECDFCGEEIINERQVYCNGFTLCRACAGPAYYIELGEHKKTNGSLSSTSVDSPNHREAKNSLPGV